MSDGKTSPVVWGLIGCGGCLVLVLALMAACGGFAFLKFGDEISEFKDNPAKAAAMLAVRANPDLEVVDSNDSDGTLTIRDNEGKTFTVDWNDIKEGKLNFSTDEGEMTIDSSGQDGTVTFSGADGETATIGGGAGLDDVPEWVPTYPSIDSVSGNYSASSGDSRQGGFSFVTTDTPKEIVDWFADKLNKEGYEESGRFTQGDTISVTFQAGNRTITLNGVRDSEKTNATVVYNGS